MMDYLDAHQQARLECLKMLSATARNAPVSEVLAVADVMAKFILDGVLPADTQAAA